MPKGPNGQKRPGDVIGAAIMVARIATGEIEDNETVSTTPKGSQGGVARAQKLESSRRVEIAKRGAKVRWQGKKAPKPTDAVE